MLVEHVTSLRIVQAVQDHVGVLQDVGVIGLQAQRQRFHLHLGVQGLQLHAGRFHLVAGKQGVLLVMQYLTVEVGWLHLLVIDENELTHAGRGQVLQGRRSQAAHAHHGDGGFGQLALGLLAKTFHR